MRVIVVIVLHLLLVLADAGPQPKCTNQDWFASNVYALAMQPLIERTTFIMTPGSAAAAAAAAVSPPCNVKGETCAKLGVNNGLDVLAVALRVLLGWQCPWASSDYCVFLACPTLSPMVDISKTDRQKCRLATQTLYCAWEHWHWGLAYVSLLLVLLGGALFVLALSVCG